MLFFVGFCIHHCKRQKRANQVHENIAVYIMECLIHEPETGFSKTKGVSLILLITCFTGRICVPVDPEKVDEFDPLSVPTIRYQLVSESVIYQVFDFPNIATYIVVVTVPLFLAIERYILHRSDMLLMVYMLLCPLVQCCISIKIVWVHCC